MQRVSKKKRKKQRKAVGYEEQPATCRSCVNYEGGLVVDGCRYQMRCVLHEFGVNPSAVCNDWEDRSGAVLERI